MNIKIWFSKTVKVTEMNKIMAISILNINVSNHAHLYSVLQ